MESIKQKILKLTVLGVIVTILDYCSCCNRHRLLRQRINRCWRYLDC